jgi:chemotaxis protein CheC
MDLREQQRDALSELINIAFSRAAAALSELTNRQVLIGQPGVNMCPIVELADTLRHFVQDEVFSVHQVFTGPVAGDALLLLDYRSAAVLADLLSGGGGLRDRLDASDREVLVEVGNILLNACLGMFGDLLQVHLRFAVPRLHLEALDGLLKSLVVGREELRYGLVVYTTFQLRESTIHGYLVIVLGVVSLDRLLQAVAEWAERTGGR